MIDLRESMDSRLKASTGNLLFGTICDSFSRENSTHASFLAQNDTSVYSYPTLQTPKYINQNTTHQFNTVSRLEWLPDGGSFVSITDDLGIRLFITPKDILKRGFESLIPFTRSYLHSSPTAFRLHPLSSLQSGICASLIASNHLPLKLVNLIPDEDGKSQLVKTFNIQDQQTEKFNKVVSLEFLSDFKFLTGSNKRIQLFDVNRANPLTSIPTLNGTTSCITLAKSDLLPSESFYAGSFSNKIQLHDKNGSIINSVTLSNGNGVMQIMESTNGRYLFCISRNSTSIQILDLRMNLLPIGELKSFSSRNQKISGDLYPESKGLLIGSNNGHLNWYKNAELGLPSTEPIRIQLNPDTSIPSVRINPMAPQMVLTSQGDRSYAQPKIDIVEVLPRD